MTAAGTRSVDYHESGHMMYTHRRALEKLTGGLRRFINSRGR